MDNVQEKFKNSNKTGGKIELAWRDVRPVTAKAKSGYAISEPWRA